jgi:phosphoribosyl 1,2-cyclic phosphodiesterase/ActR/RegA family two-component response regulator
MTQKKLHFFLIEDDNKAVELYKKSLKKYGHRVTVLKDGEDELTQIQKVKPDYILCNLMTPNFNGIELLQKIKRLYKDNQPAFISITGLPHQYDHQLAWEQGMDGYLPTSAEDKHFYADLKATLAGKMVVHFWGVRGSMPVPGKKTNRYGGNTNCVSLSFAKSQLLIFDAGTGLKELSNSLIKEKTHPINAKFFISHPHYDHIHGIPFFVPFYTKGNHFEINGASHHDQTMETLISGQMDNVYFPVTTKEFRASLTFNQIKEGAFKNENLQMTTMKLNHPGCSIGYRIQYKDKSFCYVTDNELYLESDDNFRQEDEDRLIDFIRDATFVVMDSTYNSDCEYEKKLNWGHSCISRVVDVADKAKVKTLCLFHHDPDQYDKEIDEKLRNAKKLLKARGSKVICIAAHEGDEYTI